MLLFDTYRLLRTTDGISREESEASSKTQS